jgi:D-glycero-D-manno-heptose 1,7-bisphosphate phosphatase
MHDSMPLRPALFLDRDGVINVDFGYVHRADQVAFIDGIFDLCRTAHERGYLTVVITNQAGIARGIYSEADFRNLMDWMKTRFAAADAMIDAVYHCPHHPEHGHGIYHQRCTCRKPEPGLFLAAQRDLSLDLSKSILVGDKMRDIEAGRRAGVARRILLSQSGPDLLSPQEIALPTLLSVREHVFPG